MGHRTWPLESWHGIMPQLTTWPWSGHLPWGGSCFLLCENEGYPDRPADTGPQGRSVHISGHGQYFLSAPGRSQRWPWPYRCPHEHFISSIHTADRSTAKPATASPRATTEAPVLPTSPTTSWQPRSQGEACLWVREHRWWSLPSKGTQGICTRAYSGLGALPP